MGTLKEPPLLLDKRRAPFAVVGPAARVVECKQGRTYWNALCRAPTNPGQRRSAKFVFDKNGDNTIGYVGMLPQSTGPLGLGDWLGWQSQSVGVSIDGFSRQNGARMPDTAKTPLVMVADSTLEKGCREGYVFILEHKGTTVTITQRVSVEANVPQVFAPVATFHNVPGDWCFAVGAFGGRVRVMRANQTVDGQKPRAVLSNIMVHNVPDGDLGVQGGSDLFVTFELLDTQGEPIVSHHFPEGIRAETETMDDVIGSTTVTFPDEVAMAIPADFKEGKLLIIAYDEDKDRDEVLGRGEVDVVYYTTGRPIDNVFMKGEEQIGTAGFFFPDFSLSFVLNFRGAIQIRE